MRYNEITRRYFETAPLAGILDGEHVFRGAAGSREGGTWVQFNLKVSAGGAPEVRRIEAVRFLCYGCPHTIAISAWLAETALHRPLADALAGDALILKARFGLPAEKLGRVLIIEDAWRAAVAGALGSGS